MILPENTPSTPLKGKTALPAQAGSSRQPAPPPRTQSGPPPPAYGATEGPVYVPAQHSQYDEEGYYQHVGAEPRRSPAKRFFKALLVALLIWFLLSAFVQSIVGLGRGRHPGRWNGDQDDNSPFIPAEITVRECADDHEWSKAISSSAPSGGHTVHTSFDLPVSSETLFLLARGAFSAGNVDISTSNDVTDVARVDVTVHYLHRDILDLTKVCLITRKKGENGVGFFSPRQWRHGKHGISFEIKVLLPENSKSSPLQVKNFETDLPNHGHTIADLLKRVHFNTLSLKGSNGPITGESLSFTNGLVKTSNSPITIKSLYSVNAEVHTSNKAIEGYFNATNSLVLKSSNGPIKVDVDLTHTDSGTAKLSMITSNDILESNINLFSASSSGGDFSVTADTANGPLLVKIPSSPVGSKLTLQAKTSNKLAEVTLPDTYDGAFAIRTSNQKPTVDLKSGDDPAGKGRTRFLRYYSNTKVSATGSVYWSKRGEEDSGSELGSVVVNTSNAPATLHL